MHAAQGSDLTYRGRLALALVLTMAALVVLLATSCATAQAAGVRRDSVADEEYARTVEIRAMCIKPDLSISVVYGSGVRVGGHAVLTAAHVVNCMDDSSAPLAVVVLDDSGEKHMATVEATATLDVARLDVAELPTMSTVRVAPWTRGTRACASFAVPERGRRCGEIWPSSDVFAGGIHVDAVVEHGNSGGPPAGYHRRPDRDRRAPSLLPGHERQQAGLHRRGHVSLDPGLARGRLTAPVK